MNSLDFETMLSGGHPNSLGRTVELVDIVLKDEKLLKNLFDCYKSNDEVVRLRVSNAIKRVCKEKPKWLVPYLDHMIENVSKINQASTQWTLAQLFMLLRHEMNNKQRTASTEVVKKNLSESEDWIVLNFSMEAISKWAEDDGSLKDWLLPILIKRTKDRRNSVKKRAEKYLSQL